LARRFLKPSADFAVWRVLGVAVTAQVGVSVIDQGMPTLTGYIKADLKISAATAGLAVSSFAAGKIFGAYGAGVAADRLGERRVLVFGALTTAAFAAIASFAPLALVFPLLFLAGVAGSSSTPAGGRLVLNAFPRTRHGLALGIRQTGIPLGGLIAAAILPWVAHRSSWRWSLLVGAGIAVLCVIPMARLRIDRTAAAPRRSEKTHGVLRDRNIGLLTVWGFLVVSGQYAILAFLALYLHQRAGIALWEGSLLVAAANASGIVGRIAWGAFSDRALGRGRKPLLLALTAACLASALLLFALPHNAPVGVLIIAAVVAGIALIGYQGLWVTMIAEAAGPERVGAATGLAVTFITVSIALSPPFYGLVADLAGTYRAIWAVLALIVGLAFVPAMLIRE
jgi:MFS family permease